MSKMKGKSQIYLGLVVIICLFGFSVKVIAGTTEKAPRGGDAVYRDFIGSFKNPIGHMGHTGLFIGSGEVVHMQPTGCYKANFIDDYYNKNYWGAMYLGDSKAAQKRIDEAIYIYKKKPKFGPIAYKNPYKSFRCDGLVEYCFEKAGGNIVNDTDYLSISPRYQWLSIGKMSYRAITNLGTKRFKGTVNYKELSDWLLALGVTSALLI